MTATAVLEVQNPALRDVFRYLTGAPVMDSLMRERMTRRYYRQLSVGYKDDDQPPLAPKALNDNNGPVAPLTDDERAERSLFYRNQLAISPMNSWATYYDPFARIGLRLRMGMRAVTRQRTAPRRVFG